MKNIRIIEIKKCYRWIFILLTCTMCFLAFLVLAIDYQSSYVQAKGMNEKDNLTGIQPNKTENRQLFVFVLNKAFPMAEVNYKLTNYDVPHLYKLALGKIIKFDYQDPRTLLRAQFPVLNEVNDDLAEVGYYFSEDINNTNKEPEHREIIFVEEQPNSNPVNPPPQNSNGEPASGNTIEEIGNIPANISVVSSPIKMPNKVKLDLRKPTIFIYHTHGTESYLPEEVGNFHSLNREYTVRAVGEELTKHLTNKGFKVVHDDTLHDYPSYQQSYIRGLETLKANLEKNSSLKIVFDIHRDAAPNTEDARKNSYVVINNEKVARFCFVVGMQNPNADELMTFAEYIRAKSDELYPGLAKKTITKDFRFNQYNSDYYALIEVGNTANEINEAIRTAKYLAEILDKVIQDIKE